MPFNFNPFTGKLDLTNTGTVTGTGTSGQVAYWNGTSSLTGSANITFDGTDLTLGSNLKFPAIVAGETKGTIYKSTDRFLHTYKPVAGGFASNLFLGVNAGNFTLNGNGNAWEAGGNLGIGELACNAITYGFQNVGVGHSALTLVTSGNNNFGMGANALTKITTEINNTAIGSGAIQFTKASYNVGLGAASIKGTSGVSTSPNNVGIGFQTLTNITTGLGYNIAIGYRAGDLVSSGASNIIIGYDCDPSVATASNELNIGLILRGVNMYSATGTGRIGIDIAAPTGRLHLPAGTATASSAPLKITSGGTLLTSPEDGAIETASDKIYFTIPTGTARKEFTLNDGALTSGRIPFATTNGRLTDDADLTFSTDTLSVTKAEVKAGGSTGTIAKVGGTIKTFYATAAGSTTETDLYSYTVPANVLNADGEKLIAQYAGYFDAGTTNGRLRIYFAGTQIFDSTAITYAAITSWNIGVTVMRDSSSSVECIVVAQNSAGAAIPVTTYTQITGVTFSNTNILKLTGIFSIAGPGADIQAHIGTIEWKPAA